MTSKVALAKSPGVAVQPLADVLQSSVSAVIRRFLGTGAETMQMPLGTGWDTPTQSHRDLSVTLMDPCETCQSCPPGASQHRKEGKLGCDGPSDGSGFLLGALHPKTNMTIVIPNNNKSLDPGPPASLSLLLQWCDL